MLSGIWIIFRKELVDTLRDRKTLAFMLLLPTVAIPLLFLGVNRLVLGAVRKQAVRVVTIAADERTQEAYRTLVHQWFVDTEVAAGIRIVTSPIVRALIKPEMMDSMADMPRELLTDPAVFEQWCHDLVDKMRKGLDTEVEKAEGPILELPDELRDHLVDFYWLTIKGLGLVEFVDPASLDPAPPGFDPEILPAELRAAAHADRVAAAIRNKTIHGYLRIPPTALSLTARNDGVAEVVLLHDSTIPQSQETRRRIRFVMDMVGRDVVGDRLAARGLPDEFLEPLVLKDGMDLATKSEIALSNIGGVLPYVIILFAFLGGMYPAIDLGAGEKERNTLETLILSPASRTEIALGKFLVILTAALIAALLGVISIALSIKYIALPEEALEKFEFQIEPHTALLVALLSIPPAAAFSGMFLAISIYARSFKEAQNYIAPLQFVIILPAMAALIPGMEMSWKMALIPLVNVSVLSRDFLKGDTNWGYYGATLASCLALAGACLVYAVQQFKREQVLFRS